MRLGIMMMILLLASPLAYAVTVDLNDGSSIQGNIIKQDSKSLQLNVDGITMTYYADEIKDIDGRAFGAAPLAPVTPAAGVAAPAAEKPAPAADTTASPAAPVAAIPTPNVEPTETPVAVPQAPASMPATPSSSNGIDPEKKALILKFINVFGTRQALTNNFQNMLSQIEKEKPQEADQIRQRVKVDELIDRLVPIYDRNFTSDDLKAFIAFYSSPEGQKLISTIPELMKESVQESIKYMQEKFPEAAQGAQP